MNKNTLGIPIIAIMCIPSVLYICKIHINTHIYIYIYIYHYYNWVLSPDEEDEI